MEEIVCIIAEETKVETPCKLKEEEAATDSNIASNASNDKEETKEKETNRIDADSSIEGFNQSLNITVIENLKDKDTTPKDHQSHAAAGGGGDGSDSGVEVIDGLLQPPLGSNKSDKYASSCGLEDCGTPLQSCDSSIISCCSNYEEAYAILARRNSTLIEDYKLMRTCDGTSENGSESSSVKSGSKTKVAKRPTSISTKKRVIVSESTSKSSKNATNASTSARSTRSASTAPSRGTPTNTATSRAKSIDRNATKSKTPSDKTNGSSTKPKVPENLNCPKKETKPRSTRTPSSTRTPVGTPTDDGRWPSVNSKPAPLMTRSLRGILSETPSQKSSRIHALTDSKAANSIEKYATLPRRRKEKSADSIKDLHNRPTSRENSVSRVNTLRKTLSRESTPAKYVPYLPHHHRSKPTSRTKIYHEINTQTALTSNDIEKALSGINITPASPTDVEKNEKGTQVDNKTELDRLKEKMKELTEEHAKLKEENEQNKTMLLETENKLKEEQKEKEGLQQELKQNTDRVLAILGSTITKEQQENMEGSDSLLVLENKFQNVGLVVVHQEREISELNAICRAMQRELDKGRMVQETLLQQQKDLEAESIELQEFMQAEKSTLSEEIVSLRSELGKCKDCLEMKNMELDSKLEECRHVKSLRQDNLVLQARFTALESKSRDILVQQGGAVSGAAVALSALTSRLVGLVEELVTSYKISEQELEDVIFHNEAYSNSSSSPDATPDKSQKSKLDGTTSPKRGSSFVSAVINAIKNAAAHNSFTGTKSASGDFYTDNSDSLEMLDSETEPCLMMEHVLEDVTIPDSYSHNMISSSHSFTSQRLSNRSKYCRQYSEPTSMNNSMTTTNSFSEMMISLTDPALSLVDQVIEVDNIVTRLLKVLRIIQLENDTCLNEMQDEIDCLTEQVEKQKVTNKIAVKQLKDWEALGAKLKEEVQDLKGKLTTKTNELDDTKADLQRHRKDVERLTQDICELSTICSKTEHEMKKREDEASTALIKWQESGEAPSPELLARLISTQNELTDIKEKIVEKEKQLNELTQEYLASRHVMTENWNQAIGEAKKQYEAIDNALETLHKIQPVVQQCPPLAKLQRELEETNFQYCSTMPFDYNSNAALLQAAANQAAAAAINTTA